MKSWTSGSDRIQPINIITDSGKVICINDNAYFKMGPDPLRGIPTEKYYAFTGRGLKSRYNPPVGAEIITKGMRYNEEIPKQLVKNYKNSVNYDENNPEHRRKVLEIRSGNYGLAPIPKEIEEIAERACRL